MHCGKANVRIRRAVAAQRRRVNVVWRLLLARDASVGPHCLRRGSLFFGARPAVDVIPDELLAHCDDLERKQLLVISVAE